MNRLHLLGTVSACLVVISFNARATIITVDWQTPGDNLITRDTESGLEWLDLTATSGRTYNDVTAKLGAGQEFDGWQYASTTEISGFFDAFGGDSAYYGGWSRENNGLFETIAHYWGDLVCENSGCSIGNGWSQFMTNQVVSGKHVSFGQIFNYYGNSNSSVADLVQLYINTRSRSDSDPFVGSALVRTSAVPIPTSAWLFGSGLLGLVGLARRKRA